MLWWSRDDFITIYSSAAAQVLPSHTGLSAPPTFTPRVGGAQIWCVSIKTEQNLLGICNFSFNSSKHYVTLVSQESRVHSAAMVASAQAHRHCARAIEIQQEGWSLCKKLPSKHPNAMVALVYSLSSLSAYRFCSAGHGTKARQCRTTILDSLCRSMP